MSAITIYEFASLKYKNLSRRFECGDLNIFVV